MRRMMRKGKGKTTRRSEFDAGDVSMGRGGSRKKKRTEPEQAPLPGTEALHAKAGAMDGPLQFFVASERRKETEKKGRKIVECLATLTNPFVERYPELSRLLGQSVEVATLGKGIAQTCRVKKIVAEIVSTKGDKRVKVLLDASHDGHRLVGALVTITALQQDLPLDEEREAAAAGANGKGRHATDAEPQAGTCSRCGCTEEAACMGGCAWVNAEQTLCSSCATPAELEALPKRRGWKKRGGAAAAAHA